LGYREVSRTSATCSKNTGSSGTSPRTSSDINITLYDDLMQSIDLLLLLLLLLLSKHVLQKVVPFCAKLYTGKQS
jgi:hypothetical protein